MQSLGWGKSLPGSGFAVHPGRLGSGYNKGGLQISAARWNGRIAYSFFQCQSETGFDNDRLVQHPPFFAHSTLSRPRLGNEASTGSSPHCLSILSRGAFDSITLKVHSTAHAFKHALYQAPYEGVYEVNCARASLWSCKLAGYTLRGRGYDSTPASHAVANVRLSLVYEPLATYHRHCLLPTCLLVLNSSFSYPTTHPQSTSHNPHPTTYIDISHWGKTRKKKWNNGWPRQPLPQLQL